MGEVSTACRLCESTGPHRVIAVREMMFGSRERFEYFPCVACGALQIVKTPGPEDLARYYPPDYYAHDAPGAAPTAVQWMLTRYTRYRLHLGSQPAGALLAALVPEGIFSAAGGGNVVGILGRLTLRRDTRILDVGCGGGALLDQLARAGLTNLSGVDPFIAADGETPAGVPLMKRDLSDVNGEFDLVMFNHSLEHVPDLVETLGVAREKLAAGGTCLARLPTTSSEAWDVYGADWFQIDAPRHIVVPSRRGMALAASRAGLRLEQTFDDSNLTQFMISEAYRRDIALPDIKTFRTFGPGQMWRWARRANRLNRQGRGDQAGFVLRAK